MAGVRPGVPASATACRSGSSSALLGYTPCVPLFPPPLERSHPQRGFVAEPLLNHCVPLCTRDLEIMDAGFQALTEASAGAIGGLLSTTILYPLDTCKTKFQAEAKEDGHNRYRCWCRMSVGFVSRFPVLQIRALALSAGTCWTFCGKLFFQEMF